MPLLALEKPRSAPEPRSGLRKSRVREYQTVPNASDGEREDAETPHARSKQTRYPATQRNNPLRKDDDDGPKDPNAMYWSTAPMDVLMLEDEAGCSLACCCLALGTLIMLLGGGAYWYWLHGPGALHPRLPRCTCSWQRRHPR